MSDQNDVKVPAGCKLYRLMGQYYVVDKDGILYSCADTKEQAIRNAINGVRPHGKVRF